MERVKNNLENEIAAIFKKHTKKGKEDEVAGVIGVMHMYFKQLETGDWSEKCKETDYIRKEENKDKALDFIRGFIWAMLAAGMISKGKRNEMEDRLTDLRFKQNKEETAGTMDGMAAGQEKGAACGKGRTKK